MGVRFLAASIGAVGIGLGFPPAGLWLAVFLGLALFLVGIRGASRCRSFLIGWVGGCAGYAVAFRWLWEAIERFTAAPPSTVALCIGAFVGYHALQFALFGLLAAEREAHHLGRRCMTSAALWVVIEALFPKLIPWTLADGLGASLLMRQPVDLAGAHGVSFMIVAVAAAVERSFSASFDAPSRLRAATLSVAVVTIMALYGVGRILQIDTSEANELLRVTLVQGGMGLHADATRQNSLAWEIYEPLTLAAVARRRPARAVSGRLVVWPEATLRAYLRVDEGQRRRVRRLLSVTHQPLLVGALDVPESGAGELNAAVLFSGTFSRTSRVQTYHKRKLFPFAEYVPARHWIGGLSEWPTVGRFVEGDSGRPLEVEPGIRLAPSICFEILHPGGQNRLVRDGARLLVNLSDDAWFSGTIEVKQHLRMSVMRAVETRRWLVRASDSGISAVIDSAGRVVAKLDEGAVGAVQADVPLERTMSAYVRFGDWVVPASLILLSAHCLARLRRAVRELYAWRRGLGGAPGTTAL